MSYNSWLRHSPHSGTFTNSMPRIPLIDIHVLHIPQSSFPDAVQNINASKELGKTNDPIPPWSIRWNLLEQSFMNVVPPGGSQLSDLLFC